MLLGETMVRAALPRASGTGGSAASVPVAMLASSTTSLSRFLVGLIASAGRVLPGLS